MGQQRMGRIRIPTAQQEQTKTISTSHQVYPLEPLQSTLRHQTINHLIQAQHHSGLDRTSDPHSQASVPMGVFSISARPTFRGLSHELAVPTPQTELAIQPKLTIGEPHDRYEQEADRIAAQVVNQIHASAQPSSVQGEAVQSQDLADEVRTMSWVQRQPDASGIAATPDLETEINQARGSGQPLPEPVRAPMEQAFGADFSNVKVHTDTQSDQLNQSIQAKAFTTGRDIFFRQGTYNPESRDGQAVIAHELTHVLQQQAWQVQNSQSSQAIQRLRWDALPTSVDVGGNTFTYDNWSIFWKGTSRGYENGNHFTLLGNNTVVRDIHYSILFPDPNASGHTLQVYTYYTVDGDAPNVRVTGRAIGQNTPGARLNYPWRMYIEHQEGRQWVNGIDVRGMTWSQFQALPIGTLAIDGQIQAFIQALNSKRIAQDRALISQNLPLPARGRITETFVNELVRTNDSHTLKNLYRSVNYPLSMWEAEAWSAMLNWVTS